MGNSAVARFVKIRGKAFIVEFNFIKVAGQKFDPVINTELFLNVSWNCWKGWQHEVKGNSKIKVCGLYLWESGLSFLKNLGEKSNIRYLTAENFIREKWWIFLDILSLFSIDSFPQLKLSPVKIFPYEKLYLLNTFFQVEIRNDMTFQ